MNRKTTYGMGRIYKRGRIWWVRYYHNGQECNESSRSDKEANANKLLKKRLGEIGIGRFVGPKPEKIMVKELVEDLYTDYRIRGRKNQRQLRSKVAHLLSYFGKDRAKSITLDRVKSYIDKRLGLGASPAQINRELAALKRMFNLAIQAEKLPHAPHIPSLPENNVRTGFFEREEFNALRGALPQFLRPVVTFGYYNGWRITEVLKLQWRQVDLDAKEVRLDPGTTKNGSGRVIYLDGELFDVMREQRDWILSLQREFDEIIPWVFINPRTRDRIRYFRRPWIKACEQTGLVGRIFHDFRRTAIRNMVRAGVPEIVAMQISGHKTRSVFDRYNIVSETDLREAARRITLPGTKDRDKIGTIASVRKKRISAKKA